MSRTLDAEIELTELKTAGDITPATDEVLLSVGGLVARMTISAFLAMSTSLDIEDAIVDGVTTKAPSQNAVFDALALKAPLISPSFTTPSLGVATATSIDLNGQTGATLSAASSRLQMEGVDLVTISSTDTLTNKTISSAVFSGTMSGSWTASGTVTFTLAPVFTDASGSRTALGLGTAAVVNTGTSGATIPLLNAVNTWSAIQTFSAIPVVNISSGIGGITLTSNQGGGNYGSYITMQDGANSVILRSVATGTDFRIALNSTEYFQHTTTSSRFGTSSTTNYSLNISGANSGTAGGALVNIQNNGSTITALGNISAILGGAYGSDTLWYNSNGIQARSGGSNIWLTVTSAGVSTFPLEVLYSSVVKIENNDPRLYLYDTNGASDGKGWLIYGGGASAGAQSPLIFYTTDDSYGAGAIVMQLFRSGTTAGGVNIGSPTGGDKGAGTLNTAGDIYKNNTAYTNPDYVLEHYYTGNVVKFKKNEGAAAYKGLMALDDLREFTRENWHLPQVPRDGGVGIFERADYVLRAVEENTLYILDLHDRVARLEEQLKEAA